MSCYIMDSIKEYYGDLKKDERSRYRSWEHCYFEFYKACEKVKNFQPIEEEYKKYLCIHLAFYLASWGMHRNSFLLQKDYLVHMGAVNIILESKYSSLAGISCKKLREKLTLLEELSDALKEYYDDVRRKQCGELRTELSDTLITKILLGTLGCVPAYDRYFLTGVREEKVTTGIYNTASIKKLIDFYENNDVELETLRAGMNCYDLEYPQMKILDMGFWQLGYVADCFNSFCLKIRKNNMSDAYKFADKIKELHERYKENHILTQMYFYTQAIVANTEEERNFFVKKIDKNYKGPFQGEITEIAL